MQSHSAESTKPASQTYPPLSQRFRQEFRYWLIIWTIIYAIIIILGIFQPTSLPLTIVKIGSVLLCSIYSILIYPHDHFLHIAMLTTFVADCLLAGDNLSIVGLTIFFLAQCLHLYRLLSPQKLSHHVIWLIAIAFTAMTINSTLQLFPPIFVICSFYALTLIFNLITCACWYRTQPRNLYAFCAILGFSLFACCDFCTGVSYMSLTKVFPAFLYPLANFLAWFFYYPSQIFISNSTKCATIETKEGKC